MPMARSMLIRYAPMLPTPSAMPSEPCATHVYPCPARLQSFPFAFAPAVPPIPSPHQSLLSHFPPPAQLADHVPGSMIPLLPELRALAHPTPTQMIATKPLRRTPRSTGAVPAKLLLLVVCGSPSPATGQSYGGGYNPSTLMPTTPRRPRRTRPAHVPGALLPHFTMSTAVLQSRAT
jgi:hypothetical protein